MFDRFTRQAASCFRGARGLADREGRAEIVAADLLTAILDDPSSLAVRLLSRLGVAPGDIRPGAIAAPVRGPVDRSAPGFSAGARCALSGALEAARRLGHDHIGTAHLLLALGDCDDRELEALRSRLASRADAVRALAILVAVTRRFPDERGTWWWRFIGAERRAP